MSYEIVKKICNIVLPQEESKDRLVWGFSNFGHFTIKSATWIQTDDQQADTRRDLIKRMWKLNIPPKVKMFAWMFIHERLQTKGRLSKFIKDIYKGCTLCNNGEESQSHLFFECNYAKLVWSLCNVSLPTNTNNGFNDVIDWMKTLCRVDKDDLCDHSKVFFYFFYFFILANLE